MSSLDSESSENTSSLQSKPSTVYKNPINEELNAVWFSYYELSDMIMGKTEHQFIESVNTAFDNVANLGLNAVIVHIRPSSDAFYESDIFPWSMYCTGTQGVSPGYDPLKIVVKASHERNLKIHAWINPLRVCSTKNFDKLAKGNPAKIWLEDSISENDTWVRCFDGYYYNPTVPEVRQLIIDGCMEVAKKYDIDGIQFDDYFYPTTNAQFDEKEYNEYLSEYGDSALNLNLWRKQQISSLVKGVYDAVKSYNPDIIFGISPSSNIDENTDEFYADLPLWLSTPGYVDYLCPQIYFGFEHSTVEVRFQNRLAQWSALEKSEDVRLLVGIASYKSGIKDGNSTEWIDNNNIEERQVKMCRENGNISGFMFYSYTYLFGLSDAQTSERLYLEDCFKS
ncbi:MAG: glycoside hydrolase family 10 protein [Acutalibacteraceae bacterium]